jgi:2-C-methyl-D-erythritol 4-phosphate cytidylyltransferase
VASELSSTESQTHSAPAGAVIVAAGASLRMRGLDKIWMPLAGCPLLAWTVSAFEATPAIDEIVLVVASQHVDETRELAHAEGWDKVRAIVAGGSRRRDSVRIGLEALSSTIVWTVIHDGARPRTTPQMIATGLAAAHTTGAAVATEPVKETIKRVGRNVIVETLPRMRLAQAQTPQAFGQVQLLQAHRSYDASVDLPDDATLALLAGIPLMQYPGGHENMKVTTPEDVPVVEALLAALLPRPKWGRGTGE